MIIAQNLQDVMENYDFTDSIITKVRWDMSLINLELIVDYYWDLQEGKQTTRLLKLIFKDCIHVEFVNNENIIRLPKEEIHRDSWFTIVRFTDVPNINTTETNGLKEIKKVEVYTTNYSKPYLSVAFRDVQIESFNE